MEDIKIDYQKVSADEMYTVKKLVIKMWKEGKKTAEIHELTGLCCETVRRTVRAYKKGGMSAIKPRKEGRREGTCMRLTAEQSKEIQKLIIDKDPSQLKMPFALWSRKAVKELIETKYGIVIPVRTVGDYLKRWGFTPQKPEKRSRRQNPEAVNAWLDNRYPEIRKKAKDENALIFWMDETAVQNCCNLVRGYSPKGQTPVLKIESRKMHINMVSAICNSGAIFFKIYKEAMNTDLLKDFCEKLMEEQKERKVILICDNLRVHHAHIFRDWLAERTDRIEVFYLPSYSPEYNPDEYLNNDLKHDISLKPQSRDEGEIQMHTEEFMSGLKKNPSHVAAYFDHEKLKPYKE